MTNARRAAGGTGARAGQRPLRGQGPLPLGQDPLRTLGPDDMVSIT
jgi:hypothetical protein